MLLPANTTRPFVGVLVQNTKGEHILGVSDFLTTHHDIILAIMSEAGPIAAYLWAGEGQITNTQPRRRVGKIAIINETSGLLHELQRGQLDLRRFPELAAIGTTAVQVANNVDMFESTLRRFIPGILSASFEKVHYDPEKKHLDPTLNELTKEGNLRHDIISLLYAMKMLAFFGTQNQGIHLTDTFNPTVQLLLWTAKFLKNEGEANAHLDETIFLLTKLETERTLTTEEWIKLGVLIDPFQHMVQTRRFVQVIAFDRKP